MNLSLTGKHALIGGATQGIGLAAAKCLAALGATVTVISRNEARMREVVAGLPTPEGQKHDYLQADFQFPEQVGLAVQSFLDRGAAAHILVNNTGGPPAGSVVNAAPEAFLLAYRMHLLCSQVLAQALMPGMQAAGYGRIINVISTSVKQPIPNLGVSNTTRGAVASWAKTLAGELGPLGITVNNVLPGFTETERLHALIRSIAHREGKSEEEIHARMQLETPARRFAQPEEVAAAIAFLASPAASYINGINLPVDGGRTLSL